MDYRNFNVRPWSFLWVRVCTHGGWAHRQRVSTTFVPQKNSHTFFLCSWRGSNDRFCFTYWWWDVSHFRRWVIVSVHRINRHAWWELNRAIKGSSFLTWTRNIALPNMLCLLPFWFILLHFLQTSPNKTKNCEMSGTMKRLTRCD